MLSLYLFERKYYFVLMVREMFSGTPQVISGKSWPTPKCVGVNGAEKLLHSEGREC